MCELPASLYRCAECEDGESLTAYSQAVAFGPLASDGLLARHDSTDDCFVFESSIECGLHQEGVIEKLVEGGYGRWLPCLTCNGSGKRSAFGSSVCVECKGNGSLWRLAEAVVA